MNAHLVAHMRGQHAAPVAGCGACAAKPVPHPDWAKPPASSPDWVRRLPSNAKSLDAWR